MIGINSSSRASLDTTYRNNLTSNQRITNKKYSSNQGDNYCLKSNNQKVSFTGLFDLIKKVAGDMIKEKRTLGDELNLNKDMVPDPAEYNPSEQGSGGKKGDTWTKTGLAGIAGFEVLDQTGAIDEIKSHLPIHTENEAIDKLVDALKEVKGAHLTEAGEKTVSTLTDLIHEVTEHGEHS